MVLPSALMEGAYSIFGEFIVAGSLVKNWALAIPEIKQNREVTNSSFDIDKSDLKTNIKIPSNRKERMAIVFYEYLA